MFKNKVKSTIIMGIFLTTLATNGLTAYANPSVEVVESRIQQYDNQITNSMVKIEELNNQIQEAEKSVEETKINIEKAKAEYEEANDIYGKRVKALYINGGFEMTPLRYLDVILSSKDFGDLVSNFDAVKKVMNFDKKIQEEILNKQKNLETKEVELGEKITELKGNKEIIEHELKSIETAKAEVEAQLIALGTAEGQNFINSRGAGSFVIPPMSAEASEKAKVIILEAQKYIGVPYVWGGTNPSGFDCSGYMQYIFGKNGISLPRVASDQQRTGIHVPLSKMKPGDLVFFGYPAHHVGMYIGGGQYIHAPRTGDVIRIATLDLSKISSVSRVIN